MPAYALILDDHPMVARGTAEYLRLHLPQMEVQAVPHAEGLWQAVHERGAPAMALIDFWLAEGTALDLVARLCAQCPQTAVAVVSGDDDPAIAEAARGAGARGFIHKQEPPETFARAAQALLGGLPWFCAPARIPGATQGRELPVTPAALGLSARQGEILALVLQGLPNKRIALQCGLSESTVKEHVSGILTRLGARTRVEAITRLRGRRLVLP